MPQGRKIGEEILGQILWHFCSSSCSHLSSPHLERGCVFRVPANWGLLAHSLYSFGHHGLHSLPSSHTGLQLNYSAFFLPMSSCIWVCPPVPICLKASICPLILVWLVDLQLQIPDGLKKKITTFQVVKDFCLFYKDGHDVLFCSLFSHVDTGIQ